MKLRKLAGVYYTNAKHMRRLRSKFKFIRYFLKKEDGYYLLQENGQKIRI